MPYKALKIVKKTTPMYILDYDLVVNKYSLRTSKNVQASVPFKT